MSNTDSSLRVVDVSKSYGNVEALKNVSFEVEKNEILGIVGDNGAGKSTLLKILNGYLQPDEGEIVIEGTERVLGSPQDAMNVGIAMTYQEPALVPEATVWENFFMGRELIKSYGPVKTLNKKKMVQIVDERLSEYGVESLDTEAKVGTLTGGQQQIIAISRSIEANPKILLLDEPLTELSRDDRYAVIDFVRNLREQTETTIILVSHDLDIVRDLVTHLIILREGEKTLDGSPTDITTEEIVSQMV